MQIIKGNNPATKFQVMAIESKPNSSFAFIFSGLDKINGQPNRDVLHWGIQAAVEVPGVRDPLVVPIQMFMNREDWNTLASLVEALFEQLSIEGDVHYDLRVLRYSPDGDSRYSLHYKKDGLSIDELIEELGEASEGVNLDSSGSANGKLKDGTDVFYVWERNVSETSNEDLEEILKQSNPKPSIILAR